MLQFIAMFILLFSNSYASWFSESQRADNVPIILGHMGSGTAEIMHKGNTLAGAKYGLSRLDGIEIDLQLSKNRTLWLSHNLDLPICDGVTHKCFSATSDAEIEQLNACLGANNSFSKLEEVLAFMAENYPEKHLSLDVKMWFPCAISKLNVPNLMNTIADEIVRLAVKYKLQKQIKVESANLSFLKRIRKQTADIECFYLVLSNLDKAMNVASKNGLSGISYKFNLEETLTPEDFEMYRRKGLKVQLWTINSPVAIEKAMWLKPDYLQTDSMNLGLFKTND